MKELFNYNCQKENDVTSRTNCKKDFSDNKSNNFHIDKPSGYRNATAALVFAILSLFCFGMVFSVIAICLGILSNLSLKKACHPYPLRRSVVAIILAIVSAISWVIIFTA